MSLFDVTADGLITVDSSDIKSNFETAYKEALGADLNTEAGTPQGQMIITDTKLLTYAQEECAKVANAFSVLSAVDKALDVAGGFWGYYRKSAQKTVVRAVIRGAEGTVIPAGSLASNGTDNFELLDKCTIDSTGAMSVQFQAVESGAIACVANTLTEIITVISGWDSVYNPTNGVLGYDEETDNQFRQRITANWLNIRARGEMGSIIDNMAQLDGVLSVLGRENMTNSSVTIDDIVMEPHSILLSIVGGQSADIAKTIYSQKACGVGTNGTTTVSYQDEVTGITNNYKIVRADTVDIKIQINYTANIYTPADVVDKIKKVVMNYINDNPFVIGQLISGYSLARCMDGFKYANFVSLKVAFETDTSYSDYIQTKISQMAILSEDNISCEEIDV